jgi:hypothetical protein
MSLVLDFLCRLIFLDWNQTILFYFGVPIKKADPGGSAFLKHKTAKQELT